ncbi:MAG: efflux RND transporter periplasmic adaptor subunit [Treponema sp.]|jgi:HlyD family secretion protein|nr:efflux RND transporter periplasmic adaptor subunit [Treponema sp.]
MNLRGTYRPLLAVLAFSALLGPGLLAGCGGALRGGNRGGVYEFTVVSRGIIEKTVSSTGTINPVATVKVLPRMSGKVERIYVDYNDRITPGEVLAELNTDMLKLQREQQLAQVIKARANYELQRLNHENQERLAEKNLISEYELKNSKTTLDIQGAELSAAEASLKAIETEINQYAFITSPINGIVLERNINEGDTVVDSSSSNSSSIFTLAENLEEMQIESWVGELDISLIKEKQLVRFTLESLPGSVYTGVVASKRLMPSVQDNVVSYNVIINVNNKDGSLLPGMTCSVEFIEERNENALLVPSAALRYSPLGLSEGEISEKVFNAGLAGLDAGEREAALGRRREQQTAQAQGAESRNTAAQTGLAGMLNPFQGMNRMRPPGGQGAARAAGQSRGTGREAPPPRPLWFIDGEGAFQCVMVRTGISDGANTEIVPLLPPGESGDGGLEGKTVILRERVQP